MAKGVNEEKIVFVNVIACPEGIERLTTDFPKVKIVTGMIDPSLNENKYIVPGLGDYGDRFFATQWDFNQSKRNCESDQKKLEQKLSRIF